MAGGGANLLPVASEKLSDWRTEQGCPGSQSPPGRVGSQGGGGGEGESGDGGGRGCGVVTAAAVEAAAVAAVTVGLSGRASERNAKREEERGQS